MRLVRWQRTSGALIALVASAIVGGGVVTPSLADQKTKVNTLTPIKHLVIIFGENESFDHYFGTYPAASNLPNEAAPSFFPSDDTPSVNGLSDGLLNNNPNLFNPVRLRRADAFTCLQPRLHRRTEGRKWRPDGQGRSSDITDWNW